MYYQAAQCVACTPGAVLLGDRCSALLRQPLSQSITVIALFSFTSRAGAVG